MLREREIIAVRPPSSRELEWFWFQVSEPIAGLSPPLSPPEARLTLASRIPHKPRPPSALPACAAPRALRCVEPAAA
ncbi:uncharacterized protein VTP21DRAFT_206 [Calcarisporiella thermophila]|uniref:uncharacterized protein n=1 Tax=Calcarisporiella thermophila TaxID=911321 RepID=UPI00374225E7